MWSVLQNPSTEVAPVPKCLPGTAGYLLFKVIPGSPQTSPHPISEQMTWFPVGEDTGAAHHISFDFLRNVPLPVPAFGYIRLQGGVASPREAPHCLAGSSVFLAYSCSQIYAEA